MKTFKEYFLESKIIIEASDMIVRDYGRPSPKNKEFKKDYIIIFKNKKLINGKYFQAWNYDIGFEANISQEEIDNETKPVSKAEAEAFIKYMKSQEEAMNESKMDPYENRVIDALKKFKDVSISRIGLSGPELYFDVQATFPSKKEAQNGVVDMEKAIQKEFPGAKKVNNSDWDNKPIWLQAEWKTNKQDEDNKPWEAFISIETKI